MARLGHVKPNPPYLTAEDWERIIMTKSPKEWQQAIYDIQWAHGSRVMPRDWYPKAIWSGLMESKHAQWDAEMKAHRR